MAPSHFPYKRDPDVCDLCGAHVGARKLQRVVIQQGRYPGMTGKTKLRLSRVVFVCDRHELGGAA